MKGESKMEKVTVLYSRYQLILTDRQWNKHTALEENGGRDYDSFIYDITKAYDVEWNNHRVLFSCSNADLIYIVLGIEKHLGRK